MSNRTTVYSSMCVAIIISLILIPILGLNQSAFANGFANGVYTKYSPGSTTNIVLKVFSNGFPLGSQTTNPEQIVLSASTALHRMYQISLHNQGNQVVTLNLSQWNTLPLGFIEQIEVPVPQPWSWLVYHYLELKIVPTGINQNAVFYYLDGVYYGQFSSGVYTTFNNDIVPSAVLESADYTKAHWNGVTAQGYLMPNGTPTNVYYYGGLWGANDIVGGGCLTPDQTTLAYLGTGVQGPDNVGTAGYYLGRLGGTQGISTYFALGNTPPLFFMSDKIERDYWLGNDSTVRPCSIIVS